MLSSRLRTRACVAKLAGVASVTDEVTATPVAIPDAFAASISAAASVTAAPCTTTANAAAFAPFRLMARAAAARESGLAVVETNSAALTRALLVLPLRRWRTRQIWLPH